MTSGCNGTHVLLFLLVRASPTVSETSHQPLQQFFTYIAATLLQVRANFRPEFVNRIDEYIVFEGLKREQIKLIVRIQAQRVADRLAAKKINLELRDSAVDYLVVRSWSSEIVRTAQSCLVCLFVKYKAFTASLCDSTGQASMTSLTCSFMH